MLKDAGLPVTEIGEYTGFPEMLDGRVKTLHPKVYGGILARRDIEAHRQALEDHAIPTIDIVVVNLYPFVETVANPDCTLENAIENIDIGGPTMVRAAAKNWQHVAVITSPGDYSALIQEIEADESLPELRSLIILGDERVGGCYRFGDVQTAAAATLEPCGPRTPTCSVRRMRAGPDNRR